MNTKYTGAAQKESSVDEQSCIMREYFVDGLKVWMQALLDVLFVNA